MSSPSLQTAETIRAVTFSSDLGWMAIAARGFRLTSFTFGHATARRAARALADFPCVVCDESSLDLGAASVVQLIERLRSFASGTPDDFLDVSLDLDGYTAFQRRVVRCCRQIPWGATRSYAELAAGAGSPRAARAVGTVMAANRFPLLVPCHRVIGAGGRLGGYSAPTGLTMKRRLLQMEGSLSAARG